MKVGYLITFEGGEGSGKSTQAKILANRLNSLGTKVILTREPGGSVLSEQLRSLILDPSVKDHSSLTEALLFSAARSDHLDQIIRPALGNGHTVICDRFSDSTRVYQGYAGNLDIQIIKNLEKIVLGSTIPDLTFIVDVPVSVGLHRARLRIVEKTDELQQEDVQIKSTKISEVDRYESRDIAFHEKLRKGYIEIAQIEPDRCVIINGADDVNDVANAIWGTYEKRILSKNK